MNTAALVLALSILPAGAALAGPPHIRADLRGHPTAGGFIVLTTFHHGSQQPMDLRGTAEGLVAGARTSVAMRFVALPGEAGIYAVPRTWGEVGVWVLNISTTEAHGGAGVVVGVDRAGRPAWQQTPRTYEGLTRPATAREVATLLAALDAGEAVPELRRAGIGGLLRVAGLPIALVALLAGLAGRIAWRGVAAARARRAAVAA